VCIRDEAYDHPKGEEDGRGMIDNELYKSRSEAGRMSQTQLL